jgi:hypothetical protein
VSPSILFFVEANERAARNEDVAVDDRAPDARVAADAHAGHQDALIDVAEAVDATLGQSTLPVMRLPRMMHPAEMIESSACPHRRPSSAKTNFAGGGLHLVGAERPFGIVEIEIRVDVARVHVRVVIRVEGADVAPVLRRLLVLVVETIDVTGTLR